LLKKTCEKYQLFDFFDKHRVGFTFNVELPDKQVRRNWQWHIQADEMFLDGEAVGANQAFINDSYWLLLPLRFWHDRSQTDMHLKPATTPLQQIDAQALTIQYTSEQGFTPSDTYILYMTEEGELLEMSYYKASRATPNRQVTIGGAVDVAGITFFTEFTGDNFRLFFTDLTIH